MSYSTLMVNLKPGQSNANLLQVAGSLAKALQSGVIGIVACQPMQITYTDGYVSGDLIELDRAQMSKSMGEAEAQFRRAFEHHTGMLEWRSRTIVRSPSEELAQEARCADLVVTGLASEDLSDTVARGVNTDDLVMQVGRPVLVVPSVVDRLAADRLIIAWKDTREARRAAGDALPLMRQATWVGVVEVAAEHELAAARSRIGDVVGWLERHGIAAQPLASRSTGDDAACLAAIARDQRADVIVAGAYGHSRLREWALGGVTRDLLLRGDRCSLLSH